MASQVSRVSRVRRYPVKSMLGEDVDGAEITERGLTGDRVFAVLDGGGAVGSAKHPRKWGALLSCRSTLDPGDGTVRVVLPDGAVHEAGSVELDARLSALLGRAVTVSDKSPVGGGLLERAVPEYDGGVPEVMRAAAATDSTGTAITAGRVAEGTFFDFGTVHVVTTGTLDTLRRRRPGPDFDVRRFRPNLLVDSGAAEGFPEDGWPGRRVRIGGAVLEGVVPTPRCVVPTLAHGDLPADPGLMRAVAREHRVPVLTLGDLTCVGVYLKVIEPGPVRPGDQVFVD